MGNSLYSGVLFEPKSTFYETYKFNKNNKLKTFDNDIAKWLSNRVINDLNNDELQLHELLKKSKEKISELFMVPSWCNEDFNEHDILIDAMDVLSVELQQRRFVMNDFL